MKKYRIYYWAEINDESTDLEKVVEAKCIEGAIEEFKLYTRVRGKIYKIELI